MQVQASIESLYHRYAPRVRATLIRHLGDFDSAEDALHDAFAAAVNHWPEHGVPDDPLAWLIRVGHRRGIDQIRRRQTARRHAHLLITEEDDEPEPQPIADDPLRLLFTCCHPVLAMPDRLALTLREMAGLTTEQVANALLQKTASLAQRIVRAKRRIRDAGVPYETPDEAELPKRLPDVLGVIYLIFNEGYSRSDGDSVVDVHLADEAIDLAQSLARLLPHGEAFGLLALMLLHDARRAARQDAQGDLVPLEEQQRHLWDKAQIETGMHWLEQALALTPIAPYTLQASIAAVHAKAVDAESTDWRRIERLYEALYRCQPSPVIALNRAVAVAMSDTPDAGLALLDALSSHKQVVTYHLYHAALADLHRRAGHLTDARHAYHNALALCTQGPERRFLARRLAELDQTR
ncbi:RNA polymerase sigma factor [Halomonas urumqiensis]|uniref:RNA polymerase subunit sigma-24 n=1 Tax=Halomonas urumqiensis TaxID=1684789 RepID=A0A2N7UL97_9GAMM|nr:RNA polymerase sigma factor [Halomonas urumqiensis]PMR81204.1 RNA polymerase subunit sigma-24 [Halomonas urumqiensis]PTB01785.1 RNA polymerase subunit sigma-24 [Halomonas urumqiensis]GHE22110.1 DNA-directed RNA polymerase sigma-70 factor [Halomonas urumqiensis]